MSTTITLEEWVPALGHFVPAVNFVDNEMEACYSTRACASDHEDAGSEKLRTQKARRARRPAEITLPLLFIKDGPGANWFGFVMPCNETAAGEERLVVPLRTRLDGFLLLCAGDIARVKVPTAHVVGTATVTLSTCNVSRGYCCHEVVYANGVVETLTENDILALKTLCETAACDARTARELATASSLQVAEFAKLDELVRV